MKSDNGRYADWYCGSQFKHYQRAIAIQPGVLDFLEVAQPAGDFSDPAIAQMVVIQTRSVGVLARGDFGTGRQVSRRFSPGQFVVVPPDTRSEILVEQPHVVRAFCFDTGLLRPVFERARPHSDPFDLGRLHAGMNTSPFVTAILDRMASEAIRGDSLGRMYIEYAAIGLAIALLREVESRPILARGGLAPWQLKRACEAMEAQLSDDIGLDMLAGIAGCSPTHFSRAFKQSMGMPPFQWLLDRRIERAQVLLADKRNPLAEIALAVGFAAQPQFTTAFRRVTGVTPAAWRRERL